MCCFSKGVQTIMHQLLSEPKVRAYPNPGTAYGIGAPIPSPGGPMMSAPGGYKGMSMAPPPQMGMMGSGSSYPSQGSPYGMVKSLKKYIYSYLQNVALTCDF